MDTTRYLIVGGGMTAAAAIDGIRSHDADGGIVLVGGEQHPPYKRPPLSKKLWSGGHEDKLWYDPELGGATTRLGRRIVELDLDAKRARDDAGGEYAFEKVLLATGGTPRRLGGDDGEVVYFRTLDDYRKLRAIADGGAKVVVIGGGFIGSELAASLTGVGATVTMVVPEDGVAFRVLPAGLSQFVTGYYRDKGVEVLTGETVAAVHGHAVELGSGRTLEGDAVVAGLGIIPSTELAEAAGLPVENGILVDEYGRVEGYDDVFAAGDVANFPSPVLGKRFRVEHEDHARSHGKAVGANMAGANEPYEHMPLFYSDMFDLGYEAVGEVDSRLTALEAWEEPNTKGVVTFVDEERRPRGVLLWNVWDKVDDARELIRTGSPLEEGVLLA
ncbi:MAG TPA: FAD-dependent oxidoreductase [Gaiellaceae bacterium]|jgi:NADPH-dependent 2,4-dienoyl-CoA reductase/sulfur reductase-like enzyme|nr:FAD-dependent oxidoreductase [Gaiellaceae bacterium]